MSKNKILCFGIFIEQKHEKLRLFSDLYYTNNQSGIMLQT